MSCSLCSPDLGPILHETRYWRLVAAFAADHFNYAFLGNQDRHVHLHVIPRYATPRQMDGLAFADEDWPAHYRVPAPQRILTPEQLAVVARRLS